MAKALARKRSTVLRVPQQARSRQTRQRILESAITCFERRGYDETTTAAIARRAGIGVGTLYGYFEDKRTILLELLDGAVSEIADYVVSELDPDAWREGDLTANVRKLIDTVFRTRQIQPGVQRILWERYFKDGEFRDAVEAIERRTRAALERLFAALRADGRLRIDDLSTAAFLVHASVEWVATRLVLGGGEVAIDPAFDLVSDMVSRFLLRDA